MKKNEGTVDRVVRAVLAVAAIAGSAMLGFGTVGGLVLLAVAVIMAVTAAVGFCPLYRLIGVSTCPVDAGRS